MLRFVSKNRHFLLLVIIILCLYGKLFLLGKIPFPGDLLIGSYYPWLDYYKMPVQNPLISDVFSQLFLWKYLSIDSLKHGRWPLWNPYSFTGTPLLANYQSAALYPLNLLLLLPEYYGWGLFIFSQTLVAALSMYLLTSLWIKSKLARLTGSIIFATAGLMTTWLELGSPIHGIAWLPLSLYSVESFLRQFKFRYLLLLTVSVSMSILAGHAQMLIYSLIILFCFTLMQSINKDYGKFAIRFVPIIAALTLSIIICTPQILPTIELLNKSIRLKESYTGEFNFGLLPLKDSLKFFVGDFFGNPVTRNYWGFLNYFETDAFIGTLTLPLLLYSYIYLKRSRVSLFFLMLFPVTLMLTFDNPISRTIYQLKVPLLTSSYATRMLFITIFSTAILSAFSMDQLIKEQSEKKFFKLVIWSLSAVTGILTGTILGQQVIQRIMKKFATHILLNSYLDPFITDGNYVLSNISVSFKNSILPVIMLFTFLLFFFIIMKFRLRIVKLSPISLICIVLFALLVTDLSRHFLKFNPFVSQSFIFPNVPAIQFLQKQPGMFRIGREHAEVFPPNTWIAYDLQSLEGYDPLYLNRYAKFMNFLNGVNLKTGGSSRYAELSQKYSSPHIDAANVRFFIGILRDKNGHTPGDLINFRLKETGYKKVFQDKSTVILENQNSLERVYFASSFRVASLSDIENIYLNDKSFDPRKQILLSNNLQVSQVSGKGIAEISDYSPGSVHVKTKTNSDEILVLADQYDEGWGAKIDGVDAKISPANLIFRAVKVPSGSHEIVFNYYPGSFDLGWKIALVGLTTLIILSISAKYKKIF